MVWRHGDHHVCPRAPQQRPLYTRLWVGNRWITDWTISLLQYAISGHLHSNKCRSVNTRPLGNSRWLISPLFSETVNCVTATSQCGPTAWISKFLAGLKLACDKSKWLRTLLHSSAHIHKYFIITDFACENIFNCLWSIEKTVGQKPSKQENWTLLAFKLHW